jgi:hypothetical protein
MAFSQQMTHLPREIWPLSNSMETEILSEVVQKKQE